MSLLSRIHARSLSFFPNYSIGKARTIIIPLKIIHKNSTCFQSSKILSEKSRVKYFSTSQPKTLWPQLKIISMILINPILRYSSWAVGKILKKHWGRLPLEQRQHCFTFTLSKRENKVNPIAWIPWATSTTQITKSQNCTSL